MPPHCPLRTVRSLRAALAAASLIALAALLVPAAAHERFAPPTRGDFDVEILVDGRPLPEYLARGTTYIEALRGKEYAVRLTNRTSRRVAVALAVDGLNSIDARRTSMRDARKWILGPHRSIVIEGWQTGPTTARKFFFTTEDRSYGAWLGETEDLGIISAAFFRERRPRPRPVPYTGKARDDAPPAAGAERRSASPEAPTVRDVRSEADAVAEGEDMAATGIGREVDHRVRRVAFDAEATPASVVSMRYEYRDVLVRLGVLPEAHDALARRERARGFDDSEFAPDPFR